MNFSSGVSGERSRCYTHQPSRSSLILATLFRRQATGILRSLLIIYCMEMGQYPITIRNDMNCSLEGRCKMLTKTANELIGKRARVLDNTVHPELVTHVGRIDQIVLNGFGGTVKLIVQQNTIVDLPLEAIEYCTCGEGGGCYLCAEAPVIPVTLTPIPIDMILFCPVCMEQHVDKPEPEIEWHNPPHKSHLCHKCRTIWRPADVPTNGVAQTNTKGSADTWGITCPATPPQMTPDALEEQRRRTTENDCNVATFDAREVPICPPHNSLWERGKLEPLGNCAWCIRNERDELRKRLAKIVVMEAACCPEDVSFPEYIKTLVEKIKVLTNQIDSLPGLRGKP